MSNTLVPAETPPLPEAPPVVPELPVAIISDTEADEAAAALGMRHFSSAKSKHLKKLGVFRGQQNVVHLGVGRLAACDEALSKLLDVSVDIAEDAEEDANMRIGALMAGKSIVEVIQNGIKMEVEFQADKLIGEPAKQRRRSFDTSDKPIIPVQAAAGSHVTINVDGSKANADTKPS